MVRQKNSEYQCRQHNITLHTPVSLFCKFIEPAVKKDADYQQWFDENLALDTLKHNLLYTWVETLLQQEAKSVTIVDAESIAPLTAYMTWSAGTFWQVLREIRLTRREYYQQHRHSLDEE